MSRNKPDPIKKEKQTVPKRAARKTATEPKTETSRTGGIRKGDARRASNSAGKRKTAQETVIPAGAETPLSTSRRSLPSRNGEPRSPGAERRPVSVVATIDVGFGNALFIRGEGAGLSWDSGIPLEWREGHEWVWSGDAKDPIEFKLLLNDTNWDSGENQVAKPGDRIECEPRFD